MDLKKPDRTPLMCQMSIGHMLLQLGVSPVDFWFDKDTFADGLLELRRIYGFDGILISLHGHDPGWREHISERTGGREGERVVLDDGTIMLFKDDDLPQVRSKSLPAPAIDSFDVSSLPDSLGYIPVSQGLHFRLDPANLFGIFDKVIARGGSEFSIHGEVTSPFDYFLDLFGHQDALMALIDYPDKSKQVLAHFTRSVIKLATGMSGKKVDAIKISSPFAGAAFISPDFYSEFVLPYETEIVRAVREQGVHAYLHTCGNIGDRLGIMCGAGISGIECLDPPPLGNVELDAAFGIAAGRIFIKGNVDSVNTLLRGSKDDILSDARKRLEVGKRSAGFILSTACSIAPRVRRENVLLLREVVEKWG